MIYKHQLGEIDQGDIFRDLIFNCDDSTSYPAILLTPRCDLVIPNGKKKPKAKFLKFAAIISADFVFENLLSSLKISKRQRKGEEPIDGYTYKDFMHALKNFLTGSIYPRYFYLPPLNGYFEHSVIDFQRIEVRKYKSELIESLKENKIGEIASSWREAIPVRYSSYASRIGTEAYSEEFIEKLLLENSINFNRSS